MAESFIPYTEQEEDALEELWDHRAEALYRRLRRSMDWRSRTVGRVMPISLGGLRIRLKQFTTRGKGVQEHPCSEDMVRSSLQKLIKAGLLARIGNDEALCFLCPLAKDESARIAQTHHIPPTHLSTELPTVKASRGAGFGPNHPSLKNRQLGPNAPHIKMSDVYTPQSSSTDSIGVVPSGDERGGVSRDRATPSQAGSLGRPGNPHEDPYRDRPAGSHVGPWGADSDASGRDRPPASHPALPHRLDAGADAGGTLPDGQRPTGARSSADKDSFADGIATAAAPDALLRAVLAARGIREDLQGVVDDWAHNGVTPDEVAAAIDKARAARIAADSIQPIPLKYVAKVVASNRAAARRAVERLDGKAPRAARGGVSDLEALATKLGITGARPGETREQFRDRVQAALQQSRGVSDGPA